MPPFRAEFGLHWEPRAYEGEPALRGHIEAVEWLLEAVRREFSHLGIVEIEWNSYRDAVAVLFTKATSTLMAIVRFLRGGYGLEAAILARSLMNLAIDLLYIAKVGDRQENARRFFDYGWIHAHKDLMRAREFRKAGYVDDQWLADYERSSDLVEAEFNRVRPLFEVRRKDENVIIASHWAPHPGIADRARELGADEDNAYRLAYTRLSELDHPMVREALKYKRVPQAGGIVRFDAGPQPSESERSVITALRYFLPCFDLFGEAYGIKTEPYLQKVQELVIRSRGGETGKKPKAEPRPA